MSAVAPVLAAVPARSYIQSLLAHLPGLPPSPLAWPDTLRAEALDRVGALTVPTTRDEEWRFTDLSPLTKLDVLPAQAAAALAPDDAARFHVPEAAARLVFVDGVYAPALSSLGAHDGLVVANLRAAPAEHAGAIEAHLGRHAQFHDRVFAALNTAFLRDGALVVVPRGMAAPGPVHVLHIAAQKDTASYPRCLVVAERGSAVTLVEDYVSLQPEGYLTDAVTEIVLGEGSRVEHIRIQRESAKAFHIAGCAVSLGHSSRYRSVSVALGARISRYDHDVIQAAEGTECTLDGLALIAERQLADTHTSIDHAKPNGVSRQVHKCVVGGAAHAVFNGKILVRPGAQRTDSSQSSRNLLLTGKAHVDTKPQLEIFADDVKCAHGATVGQLDAEAVFYLTSRGLSEAAARSLLTYAFGAEIIERIPIASLRRLLEAAVLEQTSRTP